MCVLYKAAVSIVNCIVAKQNALGKFKSNAYSLTVNLQPKNNCFGQTNTKGRVEVIALSRQTRSDSHTCGVACFNCQHNNKALYSSFCVECQKSASEMCCWALCWISFLLAKNSLPQVFNNLYSHHDAAPSLRVRSWTNASQSTRVDSLAVCIIIRNSLDEWVV